MDKLWQRAASCILKMNKTLQCHDGTRWNQGPIRNNRTSLTPLSTLAQLGLVSWIHWGLTKCLSVESPKQSKNNLEQNKQTNKTRQKTELRTLISSVLQFLFLFQIKNQHQIAARTDECFIHLAPYVFHTFVHQTWTRDSCSQVLLQALSDENARRWSHLPFPTQRRPSRPALVKWEFMY